MITEELNNLQNEFKRIKNMGYVPATRGGTTGIGKTFEDLLHKKEDRASLPDYHGIELKTKRGYSKSYVTLFNLTPKGNNEFEIKRLRNEYGYPDSDFKEYKVLNVSVYATNFNLIANRFLFKLDIDKKEQKVFLLILNKNMEFIERICYWDFQTLNDRLNAKFKYLALIKAWPKTVNGQQYYKYYDIEYYKLKSFDAFLDLLIKGKIRVTFKISTFKKGNRLGDIHDRGTGFEIQEIDLYNLFDIVNF